MPFHFRNASAASEHDSYLNFIENSLELIGLMDFYRKKSLGIAIHSKNTLGKMFWLT